MVNRLKIIIVTFAFVTMVVRDEKAKTYNGIGLEKANAAHVRNKAKALSLLLRIHSIHTTTYEGSRQGLKESGKLPSYTSTELGAENTQENFLLIPNLLFSLASYDTDAEHCDDLYDLQTTSEHCALCQNIHQHLHRPCLHRDIPEGSLSS